MMLGEVDYQAGIANRGEPVVRLVPAGPAPATRADAGSGRAILNWLKRHPLPAYACRSAEEIDASIRLERRRQKILVQTSSSRSAFASLRSGVSNPSVNQP
jgi:antitoxin (DNA-binding transcriptional repressor) of toxin-antitoxin stability system